MEANSLSTDDTTTDERVSTLRGAGVAEIDRPRLVRAALIVVALGLLTASVVLVITGARKNAQIDDLRNHGVSVVVTVTGCQGLIGGSGSNAAGYACRGTFNLDGRRFDEGIPGNALLAPRAKIRAVAVPGSAGLMSTAAVLSSEHASNAVFILPAVLTVLAVAMLVALLLSRRRASHDGTHTPRS